MPKPKRSITRDIVFISTEKAPIPKKGVSKIETRTYKTAVWLKDEETDWIDARLQEIKKQADEWLPVLHSLGH